MAICGATTVGLIQPHFVPAAHDHGLPVTVGAGLLAAVGIFDIVGTIGSGWLTDRIDPRLLLLTYYVLRGLSLMALPLLFAPYVHPTLLLFVVFYGLDWVATIPPTMALVREHFGARAPVVFGWVFASHQVGAAAMALVAGIIRDRLHTYDLAWYVGGALCLAAGVLSLAVGRARRPVAAVAGVCSRVIPLPLNSRSVTLLQRGTRPPAPGSVPRVELLERQSAKASLDAALTDAARGSGRHGLRRGRGRDRQDQPRARVRRARAARHARPARRVRRPAHARPARRAPRRGPAHARPARRGAGTRHVRRRRRRLARRAVRPVRRPCCSSRTCTGPTRPPSTCSPSCARRIGDLPAALVLTYRDDEVGRASPLRRLLGAAAVRQHAPASPSSGCR